MPVAKMTEGKQDRNPQAYVFLSLLALSHKFRHESPEKNRTSQVVSLS